jgi:hypothetical protein
MDIAYYNRLRQEFPDLAIINTEDFAYLKARYLRYVRMCGMGRGMTSAEEEQAISDRIANPDMAEQPFSFLGCIIFIRREAAPAASYAQTKSFVEAFAAWVDDSDKDDAGIEPMSRIN